ncbi:MAG: hypothetical protein AB7I59_17905 [Geminicoccaceae bacterium]
MTLRTLLASAILVPFAATAAHAAELAPIAAHDIRLGPVSGIVYYTDEPGGYRVVATLASDEDSRPVRFEAVLAPGQTMLLSSPREAGVAAETVEIVREADHLVVREPALIN